MSLCVKRCRIRNVIMPCCDRIKQTNLELSVDIVIPIKGTLKVIPSSSRAPRLASRLWDLRRLF